MNLYKIITLLSVVMLLGACTGPIEPPYTEPQPEPYTGGDLTLLFSDGSFEVNELESFSSESEMQQFANDYASGSNYYGGGMRMMEMDMAVGAVAESSGAMKSAPMMDGGNDFSQTNNQHKNVDEADIIKTDGKYIYTVTDNTLFIIDAYPGDDAEVVAEIDFDDRPQGIFIQDNVLAVFGSYYQHDALEDMEISPRLGMTYINFYDISNPKNPDLEDDFIITGNYDDGRLLDGSLYLMTRSHMQGRVSPVPFYIENNQVRDLPVSDVYFRPYPYDWPVFYRSYSFDMRMHNEIQDFVSVATEGSAEVYVSKNAIYFGTPKTINEYEIRQKIMVDLLDSELTSADRRLVDKIMDVDNDILSYREKQQKVMQIYQYYTEYMTSDEREELEEEIEAELKEEMEGYKHLTYTIVDKIEMDDGELHIEATGEIPGRVNNQFSFDEHDNFLRVATTIPRRWSSFEKETVESSNAVYVLDSDLDIIGELEGLAESESIFSTRFMGDRLYMVTFRQVDPFFVIDLSNPTNPKELGELKIPGFSRYLHPYDENTIIGIGKDATDEGRQLGLKISLFDVSDVQNPEEVANYVTDSKYSNSNALYEHKAFLFSKEKNLLVIPVNNYNYRDDDESYNGAFVFDIDKDDIELRGLIDHSEGSSNRYYQPLVERSLYIEDLLYTKSPNLLRVNDLDDLSSVAKLKLESSKEKIDDIIIY